MLYKYLIIIIVIELKKKKKVSESGISSDTERNDVMEWDFFASTISIKIINLLRIVILRSSLANVCLDATA